MTACTGVSEACKTGTYAQAAMYDRKVPPDSRNET